MSSSNWFYLYQKKGGEDAWVLSHADKRASDIAGINPAFVTVLDLSSIPDDSDWSKVRYRGGIYFDFDADDDIELACDQFQAFLAKLDSELNFDIAQAYLYATGGRGFHIEIPQACFLPKVPETGTAWLPYIYEAMAQSLVVDTLDLRVYSGKRGRMWRTPNVKRENGNYKVPLSLSEALTMTPGLYAELIKAPRPPEVPTPPSCNSAFAMLFDRSKAKIVTKMRGAKKRAAVANAFLDPWKAAKATPPTIEGLMSGEIVAEGAGFQQLSMQLAIYAAATSIPLAEFLDRCKGLCESHVSDSRRYGSFEKRKEELARMWRYMSENSLYEFDPAPLIKLVKPGTNVADLGIMETEDSGDKPAATATATEDGDASDGDAVQVVAGDMHKGMRKGFFMNADGMFKRNGENTEPLCRATLRNVEAFYDVDKQQFLGYEFDVVQKGHKTIRSMLGAEAFTSGVALKRFFAAHQIGFQGGDFEAMSLFDVMAEKAKRGGRVYVFPREGFMVMNNPHADTPEPVKCYLTQSTFISSLAEDDPAYFRLRYRPTQATSSYNIDIHRAPELDDSMIGAIHDLFSFTRDDVAADLIGWFVACHYRSAYLRLFDQFPLLQIWGEAGAGKSQTVLMLARMHWYLKEVSIKSSASFTPFAIDSHISSSTSAPFILDEFKPRELKQQGKGKYEKLKDVMKASYIGGDVGERGTLNKGAETTLSVIKSKATAPLVFMGEAIEMETAIIERCVTVNLTKQYQNKQREKAFNRLKADPSALSALGRAIVELGFSLNLPAMRAEVESIQAEIQASMPEIDDENIRRAAPRLIFNRAVVIHALRTLRYVLQKRFGSEFDAPIAELLKTRLANMSEDTRTTAVHTMSEASKVISRIALLSRNIDTPYEMVPNRDYIVGPGWVEIRVEKAYDQYRRYCATMHDVPLFDSLETFIYALSAYSPCIDRLCASSALRAEGSTERIVRLDQQRLNREGVQSFRS